MKAQLCKRFGGLDDLTFQEVADPRPGPNEVVIDNRVCGVNFPDSLIVKGQYQDRPELPFSPGLECAGVVSAIGSDATGIAIGTSVAAHPFYGAYAEKVLVPANRVFPLPETLSHETAAALLINYGTSYNALKRRAVLQPGETLVVLGAAGGVGLAAVELGVAMGARVIAVSSSPDKRELCRARGAHEVVDSNTDNLREVITAIAGTRGVDIVYDPIGGHGAESMLRMLNPDGRYLVIGFASGVIPSVAFNLPLLKMLSIVGVHWGPWLDVHPNESLTDMAELFELAAEEQISPHISAHFNLVDTADAIRFVTARKSTGKVVVHV